MSSQYIKSLSPQFAAQPAKPVAIGDGLPSSPESIARGQQAYDKLQCGKCHGSDGRGTGAVTTTFEDDWRQPLRGRGSHRTVDIPRRRHVARHLSALPHRHDRHADAVVRRRGQRRPRCGTSRTTSSRSARKPVWSMTADEVQHFYARQDAGGARPNRSSAARISSKRSAACMCHSPVDDEQAHAAGHEARRRHADAHRPRSAISRPAT